MTVSGSRLAAQFFADEVEHVAQALIGADLFTKIDGFRVGGKIIETESYGDDDPFSHCYCGPGAEVKVGADQMRGPPGTIYFAENGSGCTFNISCGPEGVGSAVLVRVLRPFCYGAEVMRHRRRSYRGYGQALDDDRKFFSHLCDGPQNLCDSLGINDQLYRLSHQGGLSIEDGWFELYAPDRSFAVEARPRVGLKPQLQGFKPERAALADQHLHALRRFVMTDGDARPLRCSLQQ